MIALDGAKRIERVACVLIGVDYQPIRLTDIEQDLIGQTPSEDLFRAAGEKARERDMMEDALVPESYRKQLAAVLLRRSLTSAASRAAGQSE